MKNTAKILIAINLVAIYSFAIGIATNSYLDSGIQYGLKIEKDKFLSGVASQIFCHIAHSEYNGKNANNFPPLNFKYSYPGFIVKTESINRLIEIRFAQYFRLSRNFLVNHRKSDIIFPFHYFW